jgi:DNA adenine methylase
MNSLLKTHGGKHYLASQIVALMPTHLHYVEAYFGGGAVLFAKTSVGTSEVVNDLNGHLMNFWRVLQDRKTFVEFQRRIEATPFSEVEWQDARDRLDQLNGTISHQEQIDRAARFFVLCRQSMSGRCQDFTPITRNRTRRGMNEQVSAWLKAIDGLPAVHDRLRRVLILNRPAIEVIQSQDGPNTHFYLDPPYLPEVRAAQGAWGQYEMTEEQHKELLDVITNVQGMVMLSGYPSKLYEERLTHWNRHDFDLPNNAADDIIKRRMTESVWCNFRVRSNRTKEAA